MDLTKYYAEICAEPLLSTEEEADLFLLLQDPGLPKKEREQIKDRIIRANLRFVFKEAKRRSKNDPQTFVELILAGNEGLLVGFEKYDPTCGVKFLSYAGHWVKQRIYKEMASMRIVSLPIYKQQLAAKIQRFIDSKEGSVTLDELKKEFPDVPVKDLRELHKTRYLTYYIEDLGDDPSFEIDPIGTEVESRIDGDRLAAAVAKLPQPHKNIIEMTYGLVDGNEEKSNAIAKQLGLTKSELKEYRNEALSMLQEELLIY